MTTKEDKSEDKLEELVNKIAGLLVKKKGGSKMLELWVARPLTKKLQAFPDYS